MTDKKDLLLMLKNNKLSILSTASLSGKTESAIMAMVVKDDFTILMSTEPTSRKMINIKSNPQVSVIIGGLNNDPSVQIDGQIKILNEEETSEACNYMLVARPELKEYGIETATIMAITPLWMRYSDFSKNPPEIIEFNDFKKTNHEKN